MSDYVPIPESQHKADGPLPNPLGRFIPLMAVISISVAAVGFGTGIREPRRIERRAAPVAARVEDVPAALSYIELARTKIGPNAAWEQALPQLKYEKPGIFDLVTRTEDMKRAALADRARNRAYDGAPPTIPHPVDAQSAASCSACHGEGLKVGDRVASRISHAHMTNCTQCHVEQSPIPVENAFVGLHRAGPGERASPGAPPTIPHHTGMREACTSCHGLVTRAGTRTTHPWLTNCTQCHAPTASRDQRDFSGAIR